MAEIAKGAGQRNFIIFALRKRDLCITGEYQKLLILI